MVAVAAVVERVAVAVRQAQLAMPSMLVELVLPVPQTRVAVAGDPEDQRLSAITALYLLEQLL